MKNTNAIYTVSMLAALVENGKKDYFDLITPFIVQCLPQKVGDTIDIKTITEKMQQEYGFESFIRKMTENLLDRISSRGVDGVKYITRETNRGKSVFKVAQLDDDKIFSQTRLAMRERIDKTILSLQAFLETNYICKKVPCDELKVRLADFFEEVGFSLSTRKVEEVQEITAKDGEYNYAIAKFVLSEHEKKSVTFESLVEIAKGFMSYKAIYLFSKKDTARAEVNSSLTTQLKDVVFYLDSSLVIDALQYDTDYQFDAIDELIKLIRKAGGRVFAFEHTLEEVSNAIESYAAHMDHANSFRLENLSSMNLTKEIVSGLAKTVPRDLEKRVKVKEKPSPDITVSSNSRFIIEEDRIIDWLTKNRRNGKRTSYKRHLYDAQSLQNIRVLRKGMHPKSLERGKAIILTQDPYLNKCMYDLYNNEMKHEYPYAIIDTDLAALLWIKESQDSTLPSDLLISNAYAACSLSDETIEHAFDLALKMEKQGIIPDRSSLVVSASRDFKRCLSEELHGNQEGITEESISAALEKYNQVITRQKIIEAKKNEQNQFAEDKAQIEKALSDERIRSQAEIDVRDRRIAELENQLKKKNEDEQQRKQAQIENAKQCSHKWEKNTRCVCFILLFAVSCAIACFFVIQTVEAINSNPSIIRIIVNSCISILGLWGACSLLFSEKSRIRRLINRLSGFVEKIVYSQKLQRINQEQSSEEK